MVVLRDIEKHPANVHYNTAGQLEAGGLFAAAFLEYVGKTDTAVRPAPPNCPACAMGLTAEFVFNRLDQNKNGFIEVNELGELHKSRMNDPQSMRERLQSGDVRKPPKDKRPRNGTNGPDDAER